MRAMTIAWTVLVLAGFSSAANAQLTWDETRVEAYPELGDTEVRETFTFTNTGDAPVTIEGIGSSCGCTVPEVHPRTYAPGESGSLDAVFTIGSRRGEYTSTVLVRTDVAENDVTVLRLVVHIPQVLHMEPEVLTWRIGADADPQTINIDINEDLTVHVTDVRSSNPAMPAELRVVEEGRRYAVDVTPESTEEAGHSILSIVTDFPEDEPATYRAFGRIIHIHTQTGQQAPQTDRQARAVTQQNGGEASAAAEGPSAPEAPVSTSRLTRRFDVEGTGYAISVSPRLLTWPAGSPSTPKQAEILIEGDAPLRLTGAEANTDGFLHIFEEVEPGRRYRITVSPRSTAERNTAVFELTSANEGAMPLPISLPVRAGAQ